MESPSLTSWLLCSSVKLSACVSWRCSCICYACYITPQNRKKKIFPFMSMRTIDRVQCGSTKNLYSIVWLQNDLSDVSWETCWHTHTKTHAGVLPAKAQQNTHAQWSPIASHHFIPLPLLSRLSFILMWQLLLFSATFPPFVFPGPSNTLSLLSGELDY